MNITILKSTQKSSIQKLNINKFNWYDIIKCIDPMLTIILQLNIQYMWNIWIIIEKSIDWFVNENI